MARDVKFMLQNGLRFKFRESHLLKESNTLLLKTQIMIYPPEFSRGDGGQISDEVAVRTTVITSSKRLLHFVNEGP